MRLTIHIPDTAPDASRPTLDGIAEDLGFVPNLAASVAESPALLAAFDGLRRAVGSGALDPRSREVAGLAVGVAVDNAYGVAFHSTVLGRLGVAESEIALMRDGKAPAGERLAAVFDLATELTVSRGKVADATVEATGLSTAEVLEVVAECVFAGLVGIVDNLAGRVELDEFLVQRRWG